VDTAGVNRGLLTPFLLPATRQHFRSCYSRFISTFHKGLYTFKYSHPQPHGEK